VATRAELRASVRERLEDAGANPLWSDAALDEFLAAAVRVYGASVPRPASTAVSVTGTAVTSVPLPAGVPEAGVVAVRDARGRDIPRGSGLPGPAPADAGGLGQAWRPWAGALRLQRGPRGDELGLWAVDWLAGRELAPDDVSQQPIEAGDEPVVVALAAAQAVERRMVEDAKRGNRTRDLAAAAGRFREEAALLLARRRRRARGGALVLA